MNIVRKSRGVDVIEPKGKGRYRKVSQNRNFYVVVVRDVQVAPETKGKSWDLKWRICVRGHNRRYRDENRVIYRVSWIAPFEKGPPDAPWREQRYHVLADKLLRERQWQQKYLG